MALLYGYKKRFQPSKLVGFILIIQDFLEFGSDQWWYCWNRIDVVPVTGFEMRSIQQSAFQPAGCAVRSFDQQFGNLVAGV